MKQIIDIKSLIIGIFIPITIFLLMGYGNSSYLTVRGITIVDQNDKPIINIGQNSAGGGIIDVGNRLGKQAVSISTTSTGDGAVQVYGYGGFVRASHHN